MLMYGRRLNSFDGVSIGVVTTPENQPLLERCRCSITKQYQVKHSIFFYHSEKDRTDFQQTAEVRLTSLNPNGTYTRVKDMFIMAGGFFPTAGLQYTQDALLDLFMVHLLVYIPAYAGSPSPSYSTLCFCFFFFLLLFLIVDDNFQS